MKALGIGEPDWDEMKKACPEKVAVVKGVGKRGRSYNLIVSV